MQADGLGEGSYVGGKLDVGRLIRFQQHPVRHMVQWDGGALSAAPKGWRTIRTTLTVHSITGGTPAITVSRT